MSIKTEHDIVSTLKYLAMITAEWEPGNCPSSIDTFVIKLVTNKHEIILNSFYGDQQQEIKEYMEDLEKKLLNLKDMPF